MKTTSSLSPVLLSLLFLAPALAHADAAVANSSDTDGHPVPIRANRTLTESDITKTMGACWEDQASDFFQQIFHKSPSSLDVTRSETDSSAVLLSKVDPRPRSSQVVEIDASEGDDHLKLTMSAFLRVEPETKGTDAASLEIVYGNGTADDTDVSLSTGISQGTYQDGNWYDRHNVPYTYFPTKLPYFSYDQKVTDAAYDVAGNPVSGRYLAKNVKLVVPANSGKAVKLYNIMTQHMTELRLNEQKLVQCLLAKIQG